MKIFGLLFIFCLANTFAQSSSTGDEDVVLITDGEGVITSGFTTKAPEVITKGNVYLFDNWVDKAQLFTKNKKKYIITGLNYNIKSDNFEIKMPNDSVFILDGNYIDHLNIKGTVFKKENVRNNVDFYEILLKKENISLYKKHKVRLIQGKFNPLDGSQQPNRYYKYFEYYLIKSDQSKKVNLKKKEIVSFLSDKSDDIKNYTKKNKLSYKNEKDVVKILTHYESLQQN